MDTYYLLIVIATLVGFCGLAYLLLAPIWRFLDREEKVSDQWTKEALARRRRRQGNGHDTPDPASPAAPGNDGSSSDNEAAPGETAPPEKGERPAPPDA